MEVYQPEISVLPEPDCNDAYKAWNAHYAAIQSQKEINPEIGYYKMTESRYYDTQEMGSGMKGTYKFIAGMKNFHGFVGSDNKTYHPYDNRYFIRSSEFGGNPPSKLFQLTYVNSITHRRRSGRDVSGRDQVTITSYPPAPVTNFVVCPLPIRSLGEYAITPRFTTFFVNSSKPFSQTLHQELNSLDFAAGTQTQVHTIAQGALFLFNFEQDYYQDKDNWGWVRRQGSFDGTMGHHPKLYIESRYDEYFMSTLLDTDLNDVEKWPNYPKSNHGKRFGVRDWQVASEPEKHFFVMLSPYRGWTLLTLNYPVSTSFGRNGEVLGSNLGMDWVLWIIRGINYLLTRGGNSEQATGVSASEKHKYWSVVGTVDGNRHPVRTTSGKAVNLPVWPFQEALTYIESQGTVSSGPKSP